MLHSQVDVCSSWLSAFCIIMVGRHLSNRPICNSAIREKQTHCTSIKYLVYIAMFSLIVEPNLSLLCFAFWTFRSIKVLIMQRFLG